MDAAPGPPPACHWCGGSHLELKFDIQSPPARAGRFDTCQTCGVVNFFPARAAASYDDAYYGEGDAKFPGLSGRLRSAFAIRRARRAHRIVGAAGACFDIGCGDGDFLAAMQGLGWTVNGCELPGPAFRRAAARLPGRIFDDANFHRFPDGAFDLVTLWQVFEHLADPRGTLETVHRLLKPGGTLLVAVPNPASWQAGLGGRHWLHLDPPRHLHLARPGALATLLTNAGFRVTTRVDPWVEFGVVGVVQTALNAAGRPRDEFFEALRSGWRGFSRARRMLSMAAVCALVAPAAAFAAIEAWCGHPATYELWSRRQSKRP